MDFPALKVLIFSVSIGAGHDSVAKALAQEIKAKSPSSEVLIVDTFKYINPFLNRVVKGSYIETIKFTPKVWGYLYEQAESGERLVDLGQVLSKLLSPKMVQLLKDFQPDVLVCTHAFPAGILSVLKTKKEFSMPIIACVTDFHVHSFWIHSKVDLYVVAAEDLKQLLTRENKEIKEIRAYGIPIRPQFREKPPQELVRKKLKLADKTTLLVMGGGLGLGKIEDIVAKLINESDWQVLVIAGFNERLKKRLQFLKKDNRLHVYGFVENVAEIMAAADVIITKPGGVTSSEALAMELPLVIISPLPGQEDRNTYYLLNRGAAIMVRKVEDIMMELHSLFNNPLRLQQLREMASYLKKPEAAQKTMEAIWQLALAEKSEGINKGRW